jgi:hypothetical protein
MRRWRLRMARNRNSPNLGFAMGNGTERMPAGKRGLCKDHILDPPIVRGRALPMRAEASHAIKPSPPERTARSVNRPTAISPTAMRWGSLQYFGLA